MIVEATSKAVGARDNGAKAQVAQKYTLHIQELNCEKSIYELDDHIREMALNLDLLLKLGS